MTFLRSIGLDEEADELEHRTRENSRERFRSLLATLSSQRVLFVRGDTIFSVGVTPPAEDETAYCSHCYSDLLLDEAFYRCTDCPQRFCCECYEGGLLEHDRGHLFDYSNGRRWGDGQDDEEEEDEEDDDDHDDVDEGHHDHSA